MRRGDAGGTLTGLADAVGDSGPWLVLGAAWVPVAAAWLVWTAGHLASWACGLGWTGPPFGVAFAVTLLRGGPAAPWPGVPPAAVLAVLAAEVLTVAAAGAGVAVLLRRRGRPGWLGPLRPTARGVPTRSMAGVADLAALAPAGSRARAVTLRPSLAQHPTAQYPTARRRAGRGHGRRRVDPADCGVALGQLNGSTAASHALRSSWEDVLLAVMAPRAGKTTALAVPAVLDAPGAVVATSNKADLWAATSALRAQMTGEVVWVFDPQRIVFAPQTWWWNPLRSVTSVEEAHRLAGHFVQEVRGTRTKDFWTSAAHDLLTGLLLAAADAGKDLHDVYAWLNDPTTPEPADLLREHGRTAAAASLRGRQLGAAETRDGVYETARTAAQCLRDETIMAWVTPPTGTRVPCAAGALRELDVDGFAGSRQTLHLLSRDGAGAAAPLVAAITDRVMRAAVRTAERRGGRLDPPMLVVLDEAANICRIADLPDLYSHLGSRGVVPLTILQSYRQGTRVWGEQGMDALWSAATCKVIGSGLDDAKVAEDLSRLVGEHDVPTRSTSRGRGSVSTSTSYRSQRILGPDAIRALPRGGALLLATGSRAAYVVLTPWYRSERADAVDDAIRTAGDLLTERAAHHAPTPDRAERP